jgi:pyridoxal phosphate enzyme (YggS family)
MISDNIRKLKERIDEAARRAGRKPEEIKLVAVSKHFPAEAIIEAYAAGQTLFGENYIQELQAKKDLVPPEVVFHFIGHLQSNKAKIAAATCGMIETVDSFKLGKALNSHLETLNRNIDVLIQVNIGDDANKAGIQEDQAEELLIQLNALPRVRVRGLMTMPPYEADPELSRPHFQNLRKLADRLTDKKLFAESSRPELSMGMSHDFHIALEEGATIVRVGTAIFGQRSMSTE